MSIELRVLCSGDEGVFDRLQEGVFDNAVDPKQVRAFLADPNHHIAVAIDDGEIVAFVSAVRYLHPDKPPQLWINEVATRESHRRRGLARRLMLEMLRHGAGLGCRNAWVATESDNASARSLYRSFGGQETEGVVLYEYETSSFTTSSGNPSPDPS